MKRRSFLSVAVPAALAGAAFAADKAEPRLSGHVRELIKDKNTLDIFTNKDRSVIRHVRYDGDTQFTLDGKPADAGAVEQGYRVVAVGAWDGKDLKAKTVALYKR